VCDSPLPGEFPRGSSPSSFPMPRVSNHLRAIQTRSSEPLLACQNPLLNPDRNSADNANTSATKPPAEAGGFALACCEAWAMVQPVSPTDPDYDNRGYRDPTPPSGFSPTPGQFWFGSAGVNPSVWRKRLDKASAERLAPPRSRRAVVLQVACCVAVLAAAALGFAALL